MRLAFPGLLATLAEGVTVVTPTPALAAVASEQFNREQLALGRDSWQRPAIFSFDAWMSLCWQQVRFTVPNAPSLLSLSQERELWRQIIQRDRPDLFDQRAMAAMAQRAESVLAEFQISTTSLSWQENPDAEQFLAWHKAIQQRLKAENWIVRADLWRLLPASIESGVVTSGPVVFAALTAVSPGLKAISRALTTRATQVGITSPVAATPATLLTFDNITDELNHAARAVRHLLETESAASIGVLVADLKSNTRSLLHQFHQVLYPSSPPQDHLHIQSGKLMDHPLISNALLILQLAKPRIHHAAAAAILRSPFIDGAREERHQRALACAKLKRSREMDFSQSEIEKEIWDCPILFQVFSRMEKLTRQLTASTPLPHMPLPKWSATFSNLLDAAKWPALEHPTEAELQAVTQWQNALSDLASLGLVSPPVDLDAALIHLESILSRPAEHGSWASPVQIIDANLSEGIQFDHTFILNASEDTWPPSVALSPLIPYILQRLHDVPASHAESASEERNRKTQALCSSAPAVHVSTTGRLSPLIGRFTAISSPPPIWSGAIVAEAYQAAALDAQEDSHAPPLIDSDQVHGGAGVIKAQSLCPFKAYAEYRLTAQGEDEASFGFDALERGKCAHKALEYIWNELGTQQALKALSPADLLALIARHLAQAVKDDTAGGPIYQLTSLAERDRLTGLLFDWLQIDKDRKDPFTVERIEHSEIAQVGGLKLNVRMDRVDRLANGTLLLIDYKSGKQAAPKLEGYRPKEPQLLVYAAATNDPIDGLYFAELQNRKARPVGHGAAKHFPLQKGTFDHPKDWDAFIANAKDTVHRLAEEFRRGDAAVDPQPHACDYCRIKPLCRVSLTAASEEADE